ncbi:uncharacterized protein [Heptranchias perlo]|uniref:uncharacterized protein isoform X3 n=1 Tax=Heptranchias perlo TaxID=212740 RepID=UPI0035593A82
MATRRQTLRSRASVSTPEQEAKLDEVPKSQLHTDALQCNPFIRNTSKKVEEFLLWFQTPSQPSRGSNGVLTTTPVVELQETPRRQLRQRLVEIPLPESSQQAEKSTSGSPQLETQKRDCIGHWLKKVNYGEGLPWKGRKVDRKSEGKQDADIKCNGNEENSVIQHVEAPRAELEKVQKLQKPAVRKSLRIASRRSMLEKNSSTVSVKLNCLGDNGIKSGKHVDANCEPAVIKQSEMQTPRLNRRDEEFETKEIKQENVEMDRKEDIVLGESACVTAGSSVPEQGSLSVKGMCRSLTQSGSISEDVVGAEPKPNLADKEVQTELWKLFVGTEKELKTEDTELEERTFVQDTSPKKRGVAVKKTPPLKQGRWNLRRRTVKLGSAKREEKAEGMDTERSEETLPEAESHEDKTDVQCSESLPPGTENGEIFSDFKKETVNGEENPVSRTDVAVSKRENSELFSETFSETTRMLVGPENEECMVESAQYAGEIGTVFPDMAPVAKPDNSIPLANKRHLENASPSKLVNENVPAVQTNLPGFHISETETEGTNLPGSSTSETEAGGTNLPGSLTSETEAGGTNLPGSPTSETEAGGTNLRGSPISETEAGGTNLPGSPISEAGGTNLPGSPISETEAGGTNLPGSPILETEAGGTNLPGSPISETEAEGTNLPGSSISETECNPFVKLQLRHEQRITNTEDPGMFLREADYQSMGTSVASDVQHLEGEGGLLLLPLGELDVHELKNIEADFKPLEKHSLATETTGALNICDGSVALQPAECVEGQMSGSVKCSVAMLAPEEANNSRLTIENPSSPTHGKANISDIVAVTGTTRELPMDLASKVQAENHDKHAVLKLQNARGVQACIPAEEQIIHADKDGEPATFAGSENQEAPTDSVTRKRLRRRRIRRRRRQSCSNLQAGCGSGSTDVSADVTISASGHQAQEIAVPVSHIDAAQFSAGYGVKEWRSEGSHVGRVDITKSERMKMTLGWDQAKECTETVESEPDIKEEDNAEPLKVSEKRTSAKKMKKKQEIEKAGVEEADKKIKRVNDQTKAIAAKLDQKAEEQNMEKSEETAKSALQLIVSNLDSSKTFGELQIAVINFFMERKLSVTAISIKKSRKRGHVTFLSGKDLNRAVRCDRELLLGRALRLRRPEQIQKPAAAVSGKKRKLTESAWDSTIPPPAKKKNVWKTPVLTEKNEKEPVSLPKKKKKRKQEQTVLGEETEEEKEATASPLQKKKKKHQGKVILSEKREEDAEEFTAPSIQQKKKKQEKMVLSEKGEDEGEDTAPMLQKKKEKNQEKSVLSEKREEEEEDTAPPPQKKKKKNLEKIVLSEKRDEEGEAKASVLQKKKKKNKEKRVLSVKREEKEHSASPKRKKKKKKKQEIISWYLYVQKMRPQERESELKATIGDFLNERSVAYKEIVLYPSSCSACVELYSEEDLNKALEFDVSKILGQAVRLSKVEKLGALVDEGDPRTLYVKSLPSEVCVKDLKNLFEKVAGVWIQDRQKISKRFAYVAFETAEAAENALRKSEIECKGKLIQLKHARQRSKGKRKILMVKNLSCPLSKKYLKSIFNDAEDVQVSKQKDNQSEGIAYIEFRTAKQAKVALKKFRDIGVPGQAIRIDSIEERKENPKSKSDSDVPIRSLFIWGLSSKTTVTTLKSTFKGAVTARLPTGKGKRFAFVDFETREEAVKTRAEMQDVEIDGRKVKIYFANCIKRQEEASEKPSCDLDTNGVPESSRTKPHEKRKKAKRKLSV